MEVEPNLVMKPHLYYPTTSFWNGRKVLITGHTGFKGSWLALWLTELGAEVTGLALEPDSEPNLFSQISLSNRLDHNVFDIAEVDRIRDLVSKANPDIVFHLAAQPLVRLSYLQPLRTWETNVMGVIHLLESLRAVNHQCSVVMVTTDKVYKNHEWSHGYRENDPLGGHDPYSSSKAAAEIAIESWRSSFCGSKDHQTSFLRIATARAGNVIGGGDWAQDRVVPDLIRSISSKKKLSVRNPRSTRPWQHVLEPLSGYLTLAEALHRRDLISHAFNFGPQIQSNRTVSDLVQEAFKYWSGEWTCQSDPDAPHEAGLLNLSIERAYHELSWVPRWDFPTTVKRTIDWYRRVHEGHASALQCCLDDLNLYQPAPQL